MSEQDPIAELRARFTSAAEQYPDLCGVVVSNGRERRRAAKAFVDSIDPYERERIPGGTDQTRIRRLCQMIPSNGAKHEMELDLSGFAWASGIYTNVYSVNLQRADLKHAAALLDGLAADALHRLEIPTSADSTRDWLFYLANRIEPLHRTAARKSWHVRWFDYSEHHSESAMDAIGLSEWPSWWASWLNGVFRLSAVALDSAEPNLSDYAPASTLDGFDEVVGDAKKAADYFKKAMPRVRCIPKSRRLLVHIADWHHHRRHIERARDRRDRELESEDIPSLKTPANRK